MYLLQFVAGTYFRQLEALNASEAEARGAMVLLNLKQYDGSTDNHTETSADLVFETDPNTKKPYATSRPSYAKGQWDMGHLPKEKYP